MKYFILKNGNIKTEEDVASSYELVYGETILPSDTEDIAYKFNGIIGIVDNPSIEMLIAVERPTLAMKLYSSNNNCNISVARKAIKQMEEDMTEDEKSNLAHTFMGSARNIPIYEDLEESSEENSTKENNLTEESYMSDVSEFDSVYIEDDLKGNNSEETTELMESLVHMDESGIKSNDLGFDEELDSDYKSGMGMSMMLEDLPKDVIFSDPKGELKESISEKEDVVNEELDKEINMQTADIISVNNIHTKLTSDIKESNQEDIIEKKKKKGIFKRLMSLLVFGDDNDDGYTDEEDFESDVYE